MEPNLSYLERRVHDLPMSRSLIHWFETNDLPTLQALLDLHMDRWFQLPGFTQHALNEVINLLQGEHLLGLVKD
jgi:hypothetical protein